MNAIFATSQYKVAGSRDGVITGGYRSDDLDLWHHHGWVEEMKAAHSIGSPSHPCHFNNCKRARIRRQYGQLINS